MIHFKIAELAKSEIPHAPACVAKELRITRTELYRRVRAEQHRMRASTIGDTIRKLAHEGGDIGQAAAWHGVSRAAMTRFVRQRQFEDRQGQLQDSVEKILDSGASLIELAEYHGMRKYEMKRLVSYETGRRKRFRLTPG